MTKNAGSAYCIESCVRADVEYERAQRALLVRERHAYADGFAEADIGAARRRARPNAVSRPRSVDRLCVRGRRTMEPIWHPDQAGYDNPEPWQMEQGCGTERLIKRLDFCLCVNAAETTTASHCPI